MSKNVAVFVDVANIFYAAKAAGVDIDYVTLLKAATAGRDFVRAYAYTGLDPENENQRQFHAFLARSGYKVISKDIRKYGDGRIKANLDIELVVDMMKTARNLDIAVVVSGDGDFASAVRAVQEMGVRVEVISFRGNTSSDLIEAADVFTDIAQVARVEKGSARSGRRVAAEGDLSMTEVPEKETEGAPRRRRGRAAREERVAAEAEAEAQAGNLIVLPGERLSRADGETPAEEEEEGEEAHAGQSNGREPAGEDGRRRRRRRGGRGRGRGRRTDEESPAGEQPEYAVDEEEEFEAPPPAQSPMHTFGSVWDSQLGVPSASSLPPTVDLSGGDLEDEEDYAEPEVPEYLLTERRQRGQRQGRGRGGRNRSAYQAALDRERYGRGTPQPSFGSSGGRSQERGRDRGRQGRSQQSRPQERSQRSGDRQPTEQRASGEPWSEVPPELEEMLRAELARKQTSPTAEGEAPTAEAETPTAAMSTAGPEAAEAAEAPVEAKPARKRRTTKTATKAAAPKAAATSTTTDDEPPAEVAPKKTATRTTRTRRTKAAAETAAEPAAAAEAPVEDGAAAAKEPKKPARRRRTTKATADTTEA